MVNHADGRTTQIYDRHGDTAFVRQHEDVEI
jgi:hypothetical protein